MRAAQVVLVGLLLLAGCTGSTTDMTPDAAQPTTQTTQAPTTSATQRPTSSDRNPSTLTDTSTPSFTTTRTPPPPDNPWEADPVIVAVENEAGYAHQKYDLFEQAFAYWEENAEAYAGFEVNFKLDPRAEDPDLVIMYVDDIQECGYKVNTDSFLGCADFYTGRTFDSPSKILLAQNDDNQQLKTTLKHELGHALGIEHGEEPMPLMAETNLYARASPWERSNLTYYLDYSDKPGISESRLFEEVEPVLEYFESGASDNLDNPVSFSEVDSASDANIVIAFHADPRPPEQFRGSTVEGHYQGTIQGEDYRTFTIAIYDLETNRLSWHIGSWLWWGLSQGEPRPEIFDPEECDADCRTSSWWR